MKDFDDKVAKLIANAILEHGPDPEKLSEIGITLLSMVSEIMFYLVEGDMEVLDVMVMQNEIFMRKRLEHLSNNHQTVQ